MTPHPPVAFTLRLYRALAGAFPYEFRNAYGDDVVQVTEDVVEDIWRQHGLFGLVRLVLDIALRVPAEHLAEFWQDLRYGVRMLRASPGFTAVALLSLSLGIGVATSAFSEVNGIVLRDVPGVAQPDRLVTLKPPLSFPDYQRYRERRDLFAGTMAYVAPVPLAVSFDGHAERTWGHLVTAAYFPTLGVRPAMGRIFHPDEERPGAEPTVVVSYRFWRNQRGADPLAVGKMLRINGQAVRVVGVAPEEFQGASPMMYVADLWMPVGVGARMAPELGDHALDRHDRAIFQMVARLQPGVAASRAEAALDTVARQIEQAYGEDDKNRKGRRVQLHPGGKVMPIKKEDVPFMTGFFTSLGGTILLIACSNMVNMTLARAADRRKEIAVRLALGAGRARLVRQLLTESLLVAAGAGFLGFLFAEWLMRRASGITFPQAIPITFHLEPDGRVFLFTVALTVLTALAFGLVPALRATKTDLTPVLKDGSAVLPGKYRRLTARNMLILAQVAGSLMMLLITGFLVLGLRRIAAGSLDIDTKNLYLVSLDPVREGYSPEAAQVFFQRLLERVQNLPTVTAASLADRAPMAMIGHPEVTFSQATAAAGESRVVYHGQRFVVGQDYFATLGIPILRGRGFRKDDEGSGRRTAVVGERLVRDLWKGEDPVGRRIEVAREGIPGFGFGPTYGGAVTMGDGREVYEIVGVAKNEKDGLVMVDSEVPPQIYLPLRAADFSQPFTRGVTLMVRTAPGVDAIDMVRREIATLDSNLTPFDARSMADQVDRLMFPVRVGTWTYGCIGIIGLILAAVGLAGVTAHSVARRGREIGIRIALGARSADVLSLVMKEGAVLVAVGTAIGLAGAWAGMRALSAFLSEVSRLGGTRTADPLLLIGAPLLLGGLALAACYLPARKSTRIDPVNALRQE